MKNIVYAQFSKYKRIKGHVFSGPADKYFESKTKYFESKTKKQTTKQENVMSKKKKIKVLSKKEAKNQKGGAMMCTGAPTKSKQCNTKAQNLAHAALADSMPKAPKKV